MGPSVRSSARLSQNMRCSVELFGARCASLYAESPAAPSISTGRQGSPRIASPPSESKRSLPSRRTTLGANSVGGLEVSIVLPIHNQADHIGESIEDYVNALERLPIGYELILVPNGCRDESASVCARLGRRVTVPSARLSSNAQAGVALYGRGCAQRRVITSASRIRPARLLSFSQSR